MDQIENQQLQVNESPLYRKKQQMSDISKHTQSSISNNFYNQSLLQLFQKYQGLFQIKAKVPVTDNYSLALVYTPGVGHVCLEIQKSPQENGLKYTNKGNSILCVTDSSGFADFNMNNWNNTVPIPHLEVLSIYYKTQANVDAYPIILDYTLINSAEDFFETVQQLAPAYSGFELYNVSKERCASVKKHVSELKECLYVLFTSEERSFLKEKLEQSKLQININLIISCIFRAALDTQSYGVVPTELLVKIMNELIFQQQDVGISSDDYYFTAQFIVYCAAEFYINNSRNHDKKMTLEQVDIQFQSFLIEGSASRIFDYPKDHIFGQKKSDENSLELHRRFRGMIETGPKINVKDPRCLDELFGEHQVKVISDMLLKDKHLAHEITCKRNLCAIVTNGTAILGLGDIGPLAGLPVMEGKSCLFKGLGGIDLIPICVNEKDPKKFRELIQKISPIFSAINLEDIKAPDCFEIERPLIDILDFPIFHDDQHGTAIIVTAADLNALRVVKKDISEVKVIINGGGAAGLSITELLIHSGVKNLIICDTKGAIYKDRKENMNKYKDELANLTNKDQVKGNLEEVIKDSDIFIGVSAPNCVTKEMVKSMKEKSIVMALANPVPEIYPEDALAGGAYVIATGRSDFPNQVNNSLVFPGLFRGLMDIRARTVNLEMKVAASQAIASCVTDDQLRFDYIIPNALDQRVPIIVAKAVAQVAIETRVAGRIVDPILVEDDMRTFLIEGKLRTLQKESQPVMKRKFSKTENQQ